MSIQNNRSLKKQLFCTRIEQYLVVKHISIIRFIHFVGCARFTLLSTSSFKHCNAIGSPLLSRSLFCYFIAEENSIKFVEIATQTTGIPDFINSISNSVDSNVSNLHSVPLGVDPLSALKECREPHKPYNNNTTTTTTTNCSGKVAERAIETSVAPPTTNNNKLVSSDSLVGSVKSEVRFKGETTPDAVKPDESGNSDGCVRQRNGNFIS